MIWNQPNINLYHGATVFEDFRIDKSNITMIKSTDSGARGQSAAVTGTATAFALEWPKVSILRRLDRAILPRLDFPFHVGEGNASTGKIYPANDVAPSSLAETTSQDTSHLTSVASLSLC